MLSLPKHIVSHGDLRNWQLHLAIDSNIRAMQLLCRYQESDRRNQTDRGVLATQPPTPSEFFNLPGQALEFTENNLTNASHSPLTLMLINENTDFTKSTTDTRLVVTQFQLLGIPASGYDHHVNNYGAGQPIQLSDIQRSIVSYQCEFYFCTQFFSASNTAGKAQQSLVSTWDRWSISPLAGPQAPNPKDATNQTNRVWTPSIPPPSALNPSTPSEDLSKYRVDNESIVALCTELDSMFPGLGVQVITTPASGTPVLDFGDASVSTAAFAQIMWSASNSTYDLNSLFRRVADGFGVFLRTNNPAPPPSAADMARYAATVFTNEILIEARWAWLTFPFALLFAGHLFWV